MRPIEAGCWVELIRCGPLSKPLMPLIGNRYLVANIYNNYRTCNGCGKNSMAKLVGDILGKNGACLCLLRRLPDDPDLAKESEKELTHT